MTPDTKPFNAAIDKKLYFPCSLDLNLIPSKRDDHVDKYLYFLHCIYMARIKDKTKTKFDYISLNYNYMSKVTNKKLFPKIKAFWLRNGVIEQNMNKKYSKGRYSKSFRFTAAYRDVVMRDRGYNDPLFREKVSAIQNDTSDVPTDVSTEILEFTAYNLKELRIDLDAAKAYLVERWYYGNCISNEEGEHYLFTDDMYDYYLRCAECIASQDYRLMRDDKGKRLHNNFVNFPSELRQFLTNAQGECLFNHDIRNSQPLFLAALLKQNGVVDEASLRYITDAESGLLYENLASKIGKPIVDRKKFKQKVFASVFFGEAKDYVLQSIEWLAFNELYSTVASFILEFKKRFGYEALSVALQRLESGIVLDGVIQTLARKHGRACFALSIHDSITTTKQFGEEVVHLLKAEFSKLGIQPKLTEEAF